MAVGLLDDEEVVRSKAPILEFRGEVKDSFLALTGDDVLDVASGGGDENLRQRRGDLPSTRCSPLLPWLVAKNNSRDLRHRSGDMNGRQPAVPQKPGSTPKSLSGASSVLPPMHHVEQAQAQGTGTTQARLSS